MKIHFPATELSVSHGTTFAKCGRLLRNSMFYNESWDSEITCKHCLAVMRREEAR